MFEYLSQADRQKLKELHDAIEPEDVIVIRPLGLELYYITIELSSVNYEIKLPTAVTLTTFLIDLRNYFGELNLPLFYNLEEMQNNEDYI